MMQRNEMKRITVFSLLIFLGFKNILIIMIRLFNINERFARRWCRAWKFSSIAHAFILATSRRLVLSAQITPRDA